MTLDGVTQFINRIKEECNDEDVSVNIYSSGVSLLLESASVYAKHNVVLGKGSDGTKWVIDIASITAMSR